MRDARSVMRFRKDLPFSCPSRLTAHALASSGVSSPSGPPAGAASFSLADSGASVSFIAPTNKPVNSPPLRTRIARERPDAVVFGHTHKPFCQTLGGTLYLNPGYAGKSRFGLARSMAILHCDEKGMRAEYVKL